MDAFFAAVEIRDDPSLAGKPLIIGALPSERGVVATASYEARRYGVHSAMNIKEAYRLCPDGIYMHPDHDKYASVSERLHEIWGRYTRIAEYVALDEAYLDITESAKDIGRARKIAGEIKKATLSELGLTCSVGLAYCKTAAKTASEEKKPNGYFEILTREDFVRLMSGRDVSALYTVGRKTAGLLHGAGINTVSDIREKRDAVIGILGEKHGRMVTELADGRDSRPVVPYNPLDAKSIGRELTFQKDTDDFEFLRHTLLLLSLCVSDRIKKLGLHAGGVTLKLTYANMRSITRSKTADEAEEAINIYRAGAVLLDGVTRRPVRLIGLSLYNVSEEKNVQINIRDRTSLYDLEISSELIKLGHLYKLDFAGNVSRILTGDTLYKTVEYMRRHPYRQNE